MLHTNKRSMRLPIAALIFGAFIWGLVWYPIRALEQAGISGVVVTTFTYLIALVLGVVLFYKNIRNANIFNEDAHLLFWICFFAGWANVAYILAIIHGEIVRVLLLFYLAPLWTAVFARILLSEQLGTQGFFVMALSVAGAIVMLWQPEALVPLPDSYGDWMGLLGGVMYALVNVLIRKDQSHSIQIKSIAIWLGATVIGLGCSFILALPPVISEINLQSWMVLLSVGILMFVLSIVVQYGLTYVPANRAIIVLMFELVVAAIASYVLAAETLTWKEIVGGGMIISSGLFSAKLNPASSQGVAKPCR
ncbi:Permease of the drug/metabolite transporter (DMT) superfamily [Nitrosomonas marina]|uniref:Permease of the drug/metabolite transporter (DMT) superfamily n=1 Tax=Nitrosomonas marina TaxID=917 RepID=A0A1I0DIS6_9PROT|nr:DMT family transporter [Nitrosomonas marina]SET32333.1 Permease of the drug/metabolite transporter (DMT) superfamily [Nitrosomonas marina]